MIASTMQQTPLLISSIFEHGRKIYGDSRVITVSAGGEEDRITTFREVGDRACQLAHALRKLGIEQGQVVGTFCWNNQEHLEAYFAISSMGAVLHTLNLRLFPEQLTYVINHAEDRALIIDDSLIPLVARVAASLKTIEHVIVVGAGDTSVLEVIEGAKIYRYEDLIANESKTFDWPELDENAACSACYTSGTTGDPKGVIYSHRSNYLHTLAFAGGNCTAISDRDSILPIVPMFHANAWGIPYAAWFNGCDFLMPGPLLQPEPLIAMIEKYKPTLAGAVPSIWTAVMHQLQRAPGDLSSIRLVLCGGSAVPRSLMEYFENKQNVLIHQAWGMTEMSPLGSVAQAPRGAEGEEAWVYRCTAGRVAAGVEARIVDDAGRVLPWDGESVGELEVRGPWITGAYFKVDAPEKFDDGWLRTGDVATIDALGYIRISDRAKDVIKSGGEWISSVDLENAIMGHEGVFEAAVIGVPDEKWEERPLACIVRGEGSEVSAAQLMAYLENKVAKWWLPERWTFIPEIPKTSVGKFDKKVLRTRHAQSELTIESL